jgi:iron complex transport system substrate-binding protein
MSVQIAASIRKARGPRLLAAAIAVLSLTAAACGSSGSDKKTAASASSAGFPVTVKAANGNVVVPKRPTRIVSLSATGTEMLYAIGAGKQVVAVDDTSNYPPGVPTTKLNALNPNVEAIAAYQPDLVVAAEDNGGLLDNLKRLSIPAILAPAARVFDDSYAQVDQLGRATGHQPAATDLVKKMRGQISSLVAQVPKRTQPVTYYHELDNTLYTVTSDTFIGEVYKLAGLHNIADATKDKAGGYPQLSQEFVLQAKPDFIFLADTKCCAQTPATVAARPGWADLPAVKNGHVVPLDDDVASRWGPRVPDFLKVIVDATKSTGGS